MGVTTNGEAFFCAARHDVYSMLLHTSKCASLSAHTSFHSRSTQRAVIDTDEQIHSDSRRVDSLSDRTERECDTSPPPSQIADPLSAQWGLSDGKESVCLSVCLSMCNTVYSYRVCLSIDVEPTFFIALDGEDPLSLAWSLSRLSFFLVFLTVLSTK
jgi:hypothetical protein